MTKPHVRFAAILAVAYLLALVLIAFWPTPVDRPVSGSLTGLIGWLHAHGMPSFIGYNKIEFGANILLFMPFGYIVAAWTRKWWHPLAAGLAASFLIELGQELLLPNRFGSFLDVVANTAGAALGAVIFAVLHSMHLRRRLSAATAGNHGLAATPEPEATGNASRRSTIA
ncbi:VanZ family protein [Paeniglutamicibacter sp.]|uniref:VanZ family protein n=1 Tax=Paeniglutamicibacter sp. TaxID=1934391 RepID=UPI00398A2688